MIYPLIASLLVTNAADLAKVDQADILFDLSGVATYAEGGFAGIVSLEDPSGAIALANESQSTNSIPHPGDRIRARGRTAIGGNGFIRFNCTSLDVLETGGGLSPHTVTIDELATGRFDGRLVRVRATLRDAFLDEIDSNYMYLVLADGNSTILCPKMRTTDSQRHYSSLIGSVLEATGVCYFMALGNRTLCGRVLSTCGDFTVLTRPSPDEFDVPGLADLVHAEPSQVARCGRRRVSGTVIAAWGHSKMLLRTHRNELIGAELADMRPAPSGAFVDVVGLPASDLFRINLLRARWRDHFGGRSKPGEPAEDVSARSLLTDGKGNLQFESRHHGRTIRLRGTVKALTSSEFPDGKFYLQSDSFIIPVDVSTTPSVLNALDVGYGIEVTGVCIMESENWSPYSAFPQIRGMTLVVRTPDDIKILSKPSWWTAGRLLAVLGIVLAVLGGILAWNFLLRSAVRRREGELKREIFARVNSDMKMRERQNLSIELHDSLSQGLTGVSMEIDTAKRLTDSPDELNRHLGLAASSLKACRDELRTCIYDLRNNALGDCDMNESIRRTLAPFVGNVDLQIRFNVPRERLTDTVAHNLLRIVRELVVNAVNHGRATTIKVAGALEGSLLNFSVRDNGCGFDPNACPGMAQGHFGIQGIRERLKRLNGSLSYDSAPNTGTKAVVTIDMPEDEDAEDA